jgi:hypothetical protein
MKKYLFFVFFLFSFSFIVHADDIVIVADGTCHDFDVNVFASLPAGCYDVKIDAPGLVLDNEQWRSSFFYIDDALCMSPGSANAHVKIKLANDENTLATLKLRHDSKIYEKQFIIYQNCDMHDEYVAVAATMSILIILAGIAFYCGYMKNINNSA